MKSLRQITTNFIRENFKYKSLETFLRESYKNKKDFFFIQIGAHDGISHDFIFNFLTQKNVFGLAIEPISDYFEKLKGNYSTFKDLKLLNIAIHDSQEEIKIYRIAKEYELEVPDWAIGSASIFKEHLIDKLKIPEKYIKCDAVKAMTFEKLIANHYKFNKIDLLQIDTEGYDFEILKKIDFKKVKPKIVKIEVSHLNESDFINAKKLLSDNSYLVLLEHSDIVAYQIPKIINIFVKLYKKAMF